MTRGHSRLFGQDEQAGRTIGLFLRLLGLVYLAAFVSYGVQAHGLIGEQGIVPAALYLDDLSAESWLKRYWLAPTLLWISATNAAITAVWVLGALFSVALILGLYPLVAAAASWVLYQSLVSADALFLGYQWDALLLEVGFCALFVAPLRGWPSQPWRPPRRLAVWLLRWVLFKLYFLSALVKLTAGTDHWRQLTAMSYHYETQPLPNRLGYWAHHWPEWMHQASVVGTLAIEGGLVFLVFFSRRLRLVAFAGMLSLQLLVAATGNYGFFNLLTAALCVTLLDDGVLARIWPRARRAEAIERCRGAAARLANGALIGMVVVSLILSTAMAVYSRMPRDQRPEWLGDAIFWASRPSVANAYGLFEDMTTERPEIMIQGSRDGRQWQTYVFVHKAGPRARPPTFAGPHMPRLDWQLWFAALYGDCRAGRARWYLAFARRLLEGSDDVRGLLAHDPFGDDPPRYLRSMVYDYRFTTEAERSQSGLWWERDGARPFCPILTLSDGELRAVDLEPRER